MALPAKKLSKRELPLGTNIATGNQLSLSGEWLQTGLHLIGPTGCGKSMVLFFLFQQLVKIRNATIFLFDPKGSLYRMARDWCILHGLTDLLVLFDLGEEEASIGYSNLRPNGQSVPAQVKFAREGFRSAWGQNSFDQTPQLARILFMILFVARTLELGLVEALGLLRPGSAVRKRALAKLPPSYIREALGYFDSLPERRQEELAASTLARLEPFVADPQIARVVGQQERSLDLATVLKQHKVLLANLEHYRPLLPDDSRLLGRMLINDVIAHTFERSEAEQDPVFLIIDEVQEVATRDLCAALDRGRGLGLHVILAHQHCAQLMEEDKTGYLFHSVMNDARTKIIFGGSSARDLEQFLVKEVLIDQFDPWTIKDELTSLELDPEEETRTSITKTTSRSQGRGLAFPSSETIGDSDTTTSGISDSTSYGTEESESQASTRGTTRGASQAYGASENESQASTRGTSASSSLTRGVSETHADTWADTHASAENWSESDGEGEAFSEGSTDSTGSGESGASDFCFTFDADGDYTRAYHYTNGWSTHEDSSRTSARSNSSFSSQTYGGSTIDASTVGGSVARSSSASMGEAHASSESTTRGANRGKSAEFGLNQSASESETLGRGKGISQGVGHTTSTSHGRTTSKAATYGMTPSVSAEEGESRSVTTAPFYAYHKRRVVSHRTFLTEQEFLMLGLQRIKGQSVGHFLIKVPTRPAVFIRAPFVRPPRITARQLTEAKNRIFAQPYYTRLTDIPLEGETPQDVSYEKEQVVNSHADRSTPRTPRKPRRAKTAPTS